MKDKTPKEAARPKVRELYASMLEVKDRREALFQAIEERMKALRGPASDNDARALSRDDTLKSAADAKAAFLRLKNAFKSLDVDIDSSNPALSSAIDEFITEQQSIYVIKSIDVDVVGPLGIAQRHLQENRANLQNALKQLRALTQRVYPDFGELLSPGILR